MENTGRPGYTMRVQVMTNGSRRWYGRRPPAAPRAALPVPRFEPDESPIKALIRIREGSGATYRPGHEQYTLFTWAGIAPDRPTETADVYGLRRHLRHLALMAVGITGLPWKDEKHPNSVEIISVLSPLIWQNGCSVTSTPHVRTLSASPSYGRPPFDFTRESLWAKVSAFLAEQLLTLAGISRGDRLDQYQQLVGPAAIRFPKLVVRVEGEKSDHGIPPAPIFLPISEVGEDVEVHPDHMMFEIESMNHAVDIRASTPERPDMAPIYDAVPWFVLPTHIRAVKLDPIQFDGIEAGWILE